MFLDGVESGRDGEGKAAGGRSRLRHQVQDDGFLFEMPIEIEIQYEDKRQNKFDKIVLDRKSKKFYINSKNRPVRIIIDPNTTLLAQWDFNEI